MTNTKTQHTMGIWGDATATRKPDSTYFFFDGNGSGSSTRSPSMQGKQSEAHAGTHHAIRARGSGRRRSLCSRYFWMFCRFVIISAWRSDAVGGGGGGGGSSGGGGTGKRVRGWPCCTWLGFKQPRRVRATKKL